MRVSLRIPTLCAALATAVAHAVGSPADAGPEARFVEPPMDCRILKIIHGWPEGSATQDQWMESLRRQGFGGAVCNVAHTDYLVSDTGWRAFRRAVETAHARGLALWLYDEKGYPSGLAGGQVLATDPAWEAEGLLAVERTSTEGRLSLAVPPGKLMLAAAYPAEDGRIRIGQGRNLAAHVQAGRFEWDAPAGTWQVLVLTHSRLYEGTHAEGNLSAPLPYPNLLRREPTVRFLELTHGRYAWHLGPDLGWWFRSTFTDEPSLMSLFLRRMPWRPLPWSPDLPAEFTRRRGYALEPVLPSLVLDTGPEGFRHRHDFWRTIGELLAENTFAQIRETCRRLRIRSGGHLLAEEGLTSHVALYGDFFACLRQMDAPGIDCLTSVPSEVPWHIAKLAAGAADLGGHSVVMCETSDHAQVWRAPGDTRPRRVVTESEIRGTLNRLMVSGVNSITSYFSWSGLDDAALNRLNEWAGRLCALMRGGSPAGSVAVLYPAASLQAHFVPAQHWAAASPVANRIDFTFRTVLQELWTARREFTVIDEPTLAAAATRQGMLAHRDSRWRVLVLPDVDVLSLPALQRISDFVEDGGILIAAGSRPASDGREFPATAVEVLTRRLLGDPGAVSTVQIHKYGNGIGVFLPSGQEILLNPLLDGWQPADVHCESPAPALRSSHRRIDRQEVFLVINDSPEPWAGRLSFAADGHGKRLDPATGGATSGVDPRGTTVELGPFGAAGFLFPQSTPSKRAPRSLPATPTVVRHPIPVSEPLVSRGEWVQEEFHGHTDATGKRTWQARARLTKADVDTFLFVRFPVAQPTDLSGADAVGFGVSVPEGVRPATQLLAVLAEQGGGDFLASTPCSLAAPGDLELLVPVRQLQLAGWSRDEDGVLDLSRVAEIRIGWGGYHGAESERVEFSTTAPVAVRVP